VNRRSAPGVVTVECVLRRTHDQAHAHSGG
jgi:hypothetical protein